MPEGDINGQSEDNHSSLMPEFCFNMQDGKNISLSSFISIITFL